MAVVSVGGHNADYFTPKGPLENVHYEPLEARLISSHGTDEHQEPACHGAQISLVYLVGVQTNCCVRETEEDCKTIYSCPKLGESVSIYTHISPTRSGEIQG